ncbi:hypothetical protein GC098_18845 [Paenibacillus sp. LMG 31458]|uniref:Recombinase family protein n=1 Tax=Paenibacillus phytorum TaxID=2654977 RepID=A0ABX1XXZ7_9BACL|nr:recombinase family protein [Paenibacillus phytorum]NOU73453.1 hypothetical protein [Paenibacillus phytorum]
MNPIIAELVRSEKRGVTYGRVSTKKQDIMKQTNTLNEFVNKYGCNIVNRYEDPGVSAEKVKLEKRTGFATLLADATKKQFDYVLVWDFERVSRDQEEHEFIRKKMGNLNIPILLIESEDFYDTGDLMSNAVRDGISRFRLEKIRIDTINGKKTVAQNGMWPGGRAPYGYKYNKANKRFNPISEELVIVKEIFERYKNYGSTFKMVADSLKKEEIVGNHWDSQKVKSVLLNPLYAGYIAMRRRKKNSRNSIQYNRDNWIMRKSLQIKDPVISLEQWEETWKLYLERKDIKPRHFTTPFYLKGILTCAHCEANLECKNQMTGKGKKEYGGLIYRCRSNSCMYKISLDTAHRLISDIWKELRRVNVTQFLGRISFVITHDEGNLTFEIENLRQSIAEKQELLKMWDEKFDTIHQENRTQENRTQENRTQEPMLIALSITKGVTIQKLDNEVRLLKSKVKELNKINDFKSDNNYSEKFMEMVNADWESLNSKSIRSIITMFVEKITVNRDGQLHYRIYKDLSED